MRRHARMTIEEHREFGQFLKSIRVTVNARTLNRFPVNSPERRAMLRLLAATTALQSAMDNAVERLMPPSVDSRGKFKAIYFGDSQPYPMQKIAHE